jgi:Spy/CpxP family protein refolding chaperone
MEKLPIGETEMKRIYGFALVAAVAAAPLALPADAHAQEQTVRQRGAGAHEGILRLRQELGLTADQVQRLEAIRANLRAQNAPLVEQLRASGAWKRGEGARALTPEQREQMRQRAQAMTPEQRAQMRQQMRERRGGERPAAGERRAMSPEQRAEMRQRMEAMSPEQRAEMRRQMGERRAGQPRGAAVPEELRPVMEQIRANTRAAMEQSRAVLTAEQQARLAELRAQRAGERGQRGPGFRGGARNR